MVYIAAGLAATIVVGVTFTFFVVRAHRASSNDPSRE
jgi:hypothetical protein